MRKYLFADEVGDFEFSNKQGASRYFIICTIVCDSCDAGLKLLSLRRNMAWENKPLADYFHCTEDKQSIRDEVFAFIKSETFRIDATILEKRKAHPKIRPDKHRFYQYGWYYHLKYLAPKILAQPTKELMVTAASLGTNKERAQFKATINDVMQQTAATHVWAASFWPCASDPCLQIADYCTWAIQRKWEKGDSRSYDLIRDKIRSEYELFARGQATYY